MIKKTALILVIILASLLTSCAPHTDLDGTADQTESTNSEVRYATMNAHWSFYSDAEELSEDADVVIVATVTDISFQVLDMTTALPPTKGTDERDRCLNTIYDIDVITVYKGDVPEPAQIEVFGGVMGYREEEQIKLQKEMDVWPYDTIPVYSGMARFRIGETYLFALKKSTVTDVLIILYPAQSIHNLKNPFGKGANVVEPPEASAASTPQREIPAFTAKDVISVFGQDKWDAFWSQWQKDNPGWESRLDKAAVEKALAAN